MRPRRFFRSFHGLLFWSTVVLFGGASARPEPLRQAEVVPGYPERPWFVFSTDLSSDVNDAAAFGFLFEALQRGRGRLAACVTDSPVAAAAPAARAILDAWGFRSVPLGAYQGDSGNSRDGPYARDVADAFGQQGRTREDFESDVAVLRIPPQSVSPPTRTANSSDSTIGACGSKSGKAGCRSILLAKAPSRSSNSACPPPATKRATT